MILLNQYYAPDEAATAQMLGDLGAHLAAAGHEVIAICCDRSYGRPEKRYAAREVIDGVHIQRVRTTSFGRRSKAGRLTDYLTFLLGAARRVISSRADVVLVLTTPPLIAALPLLFRRFSRYRVILWSMDVYPDLAFELGVIKPGSLVGRLLSRFGRTVLSRADKVVALGETMASRLTSLGAKSVAVVHNWADEKAITAQIGVDRPERAQWGWTGKLVILYSGNLGLAHEFETVLNAARQLETNMPNVLFAFIGVGPRLEETRRAASGLRNVEFREYVERNRLAGSLSAADVHLVTLRPRMPGLLVPSKIYGILASGRPTIYVGPSEGEIHDILREGRCGATVPNDDPAALISAIREYSYDPFRRDEEGKRARALFEARFTKSKAVAAFQAIVEGP